MSTRAAHPLMSTETAMVSATEGRAVQGNKHMSISGTVPTWAQDRETCFVCCVACEESSRRRRDEARYDRSAAAGPDFRDKHETSNGERCGGESGT